MPGRLPTWAPPALQDHRNSSSPVTAAGSCTVSESRTLGGSRPAADCDSTQLPGGWVSHCHSAPVALTGLLSHTQVHEWQILWTPKEGMASEASPWATSRRPWAPGSAVLGVNGVDPGASAGPGVSSCTASLASPRTTQSQGQTKAERSHSCASRVLNADTGAPPGAEKPLGQAWAPPAKRRPGSCVS